LLQPQETENNMRIFMLIAVVIALLAVLFHYGFFA
jgi:hypothetical protein